ncbi:chromate efflux transporter [Bdellovibrio sp. HCB337]|uniref:chromate efflux transporter n=1 Tax=Bdellovibrio sp. HCB337 TaxID=3394358 RepID=UPI0039A548F4
MKLLLDQEGMRVIAEVFITFLKLGCTSFGGPVAHLGYFQNEFVNRKKWLDESSYADLVGLCQFLPGPASSQVGMGIGFSRAGLPGALAAWVGFTLPSAILLVLFALGLTYFQDQLGSQWLHGLKVAAVAVVAQALLNMFPKLCPDRKRVVLALLIAMVVTAQPAALGQVVALFFAGLWGWFFLKDQASLPHQPASLNLSRSRGLVFLSLFFVFLIVLPLLAGVTDSQTLKYFDSFYRAGSLVFGGGHVVLPLLQSEIVRQGWISQESFMAGYGAAQAVPGPLFTFAAYLGAASLVAPNGWLGALVCLVAVFLPSLLLIVGILPYWEKMRAHKKLRTAMAGMNAGVVGLLVAAFYNPVVTYGILNLKDVLLAAICLSLLVFAKWPSWSIVLMSAVATGVLW